MKDKKGRTDDIGNPAALSAYSFNAVMQQVAQFYCHPTRGLGIDLYWVRKDFVFDGPQLSSADGTLTVSNAYRYTGNMIRKEHSGAESTNVITGLIHSDWRFYKKIPMEKFRDLYNTDPVMIAQNKLFPTVHALSMEGFCKLVLIDRWCMITPALVDEVMTIAEEKCGSNAFAKFADAIPASQSGALVAVAGIAEEGPMEQYLQEYSGAVFLARLEFSISHELAHLIIRQQFGAGWVEGGHRDSSTSLMGRVLPPSGLSAVCADAEEISKINLRNRASVVKK